MTAGGGGNGHEGARLFTGEAVAVTFHVPRLQFRALAKAAKGRNTPPNAYAQQLFDAGYAARVGQERGEAVTDAELDEQVTLVFACAGQGSTAAIAKAIGIPEARVVRILEGWRLSRQSETSKG